MNPLEFAVSMLAPHTCRFCKTEGRPVCLECAHKHLLPARERCYKCAFPSPRFKTCHVCFSEARISYVWVAADYRGAAKEMIGLLKFQRMKAAALDIAEWMDLQIPAVPPNTLISSIPTANKRVRGRGYDQAELIAKHIARRRKLKYVKVIRRVGNTRQVGAVRQKRFKQLDKAFIAIKPRTLREKRILLIDDVMTTGATVEAAAKALNGSGALSIAAAVFAHQAAKSEYSSNTKNDAGLSRE